MEFENTKQAEDHFVKYLPLGSVEVKNDNYWVNYHKKPVMGEWLLFRHIKDRMISPPILGLVVGHSIWDMALALEYVTEWRAWECNSEVLNILVNHYYPIASNDKTVKHIQFWTDDISVLGHWQNKPRFGELRAALTL